MSGFRPVGWLLDQGCRYTYWLTARFTRAGILAFVEAELRAARSAVGRDLRVLNVGAGGVLGGGVERFEGIKVLSLDLNAGRGPDVVADVCLLPLRDHGTFDVVALLEVLEHVESPKKAIAEVERILKPGGRILVSVPFVFGIHDAPHDYRRWTEFGLAELLSSFEQLVIRARNGYLQAALVLLLRLSLSKHALDRFIAIIIAAWTSLFFPLVALLDWMVRSDAVTTGYVARAVKRMG